VKKFPDPPWKIREQELVRTAIRGFVATWKLYGDRGGPSAIANKIVQLRAELPDNDPILTDCDPPRSLLVAIDRYHRHNQAEVRHVPSDDQQRAHDLRRLQRQWRRMPRVPALQLLRGQRRRSADRSLRVVM